MTAMPASNTNRRSFSSIAFVGMVGPKGYSSENSNRPPRLTSPPTYRYVVYPIRISGDQRDCERHGGKSSRSPASLDLVSYGVACSSVSPSCRGTNETISPGVGVDAVLTLVNVTSLP